MEAWKPRGWHQSLSHCCARLAKDSPGPRSRLTPGGRSLQTLPLHLGCAGGGEEAWESGSPWCVPSAGLGLCPAHLEGGNQQEQRMLGIASCPSEPPLMSLRGARSGMEGGRDHEREAPLAKCLAKDEPAIDPKPEPMGLSVAWGVGSHPLLIGGYTPSVLPHPPRPCTFSAGK